MQMMGHALARCARPRRAPIANFIKELWSDRGRPGEYLPRRGVRQFDGVLTRIGRDSSLDAGERSRLIPGMVRPSGVEPPLLSEHGPEPCASANSATGAPWSRVGGR